MIEIDGTRAAREETPASARELSRLMGEAYGAGLSMIPVGGGTKLHLGFPPRSAQLAIRTSLLRGIIEYEPDNMTVTVQAGTPFQELQQVLRAKNQFLPLDPPHPGEATIGGVVSCNTSGPIRFRYGTTRDMLIGVKIVHPDGTETKAGGKLVKNVTGYDMCKLYTGSLGTLGILSELTFKVQPLPECLATVLLGYPALKDALEATQLFLRSDLLPDAVEAWNTRAAGALSGFSKTGGSPWILMVRFGEVEPAVGWQVARIQEISGGTGGQILGILSTTDSEEFWNRAATAREGRNTNQVALLKCSVLYQSTAETASRLEDLGQRLKAQTSLFCHAGTYIVYGRYEWEQAEEIPAEELRRGIQSLRAHCTSAGGHLVVERVRPDVKTGLDVWGYDAPALKIMRSIKQEFDPKGLLNPGRFVGGI